MVVMLFPLLKGADPGYSESQVKSWLCCISNRFSDVLYFAVTGEIMALLQTVHSQMCCASQAARILSHFTINKGAQHINVHLWL